MIEGYPEWVAYLDENGDPRDANGNAWAGTTCPFCGVARDEVCRADCEGQA